MSPSSPQSPKQPPKAKVAAGGAAGPPARPSPTCNPKVAVGRPAAYEVAGMAQHDRWEAWWSREEFDEVTAEDHSTTEDEPEDNPEKQMQELRNNEAYLVAQIQLTKKAMALLLRPTIRGSSRNS